jgi:hypothetical protein
MQGKIREYGCAGPSRAPCSAAVSPSFRSVSLSSPEPGGRPMVASLHLRSTTPVCPPPGPDWRKSDVRRLAGAPVSRMADAGSVPGEPQFDGGLLRLPVPDETAFCDALSWVRGYRSARREATGRAPQPPSPPEGLIRAPTRFTASSDGRDVPRELKRAGELCLAFASTAAPRLDHRSTPSPTPPTGKGPTGSGRRCRLSPTALNRQQPRMPVESNCPHHR